MNKNQLTTGGETDAEPYEIVELLKKSVATR